jgi:hypothetical protein
MGMLKSPDPMYQTRRGFVRVAVFPSMFRFFRVTYLQDLRIARTGQQTVSRVTGVRTRWNSLVRIQRRPLDLRRICGGEPRLIGTGRDLPSRRARKSPR